jgi:large-conductance mechanosensitive channel
MNGKDIMGAISLVMAVVILVVISALIVGSLLGNSVFTELTIINTTAIAESFGSFVTGLIAFLAIIGTIVGVVWLVKYVRKLFDKDEGLTNLTA